ncbi:MAG: 1-(5-phosphoribosyl)-5-[(5-phosphoribosylamino)methylideneamino]imidazole-4-carboxamide isomerase [Bacteroidia bacterium]|nr:1-(5-phosphoribosyl)-5-[(5-phosphoribosylamino)methylideneamino]imidazole-4-carboxamide isomerase [Bacteroidia bacterium]
MRIIPAIDIIDGKCVRLTKGDYSTQKIYNENPLEVAKEFEANGIRYLHLVDLDGAKSKHIVNHVILKEISTKTSLIVDFGGGIKTDEDIRIAFENGAAQITGGSIAAQQPETFLRWLATYGADKIILGADSHNRKIATHGWQQQSQLDVVDFIAGYEQKGVEYVVCTDISKDGMLQGTSNDLYAEILHRTNVKLIASGGVSSINDLMELKRIGCEGAIIGKAIYEGHIKLMELRSLIDNALGGLTLCDKTEN